MHLNHRCIERGKSSTKVSYFVREVLRQMTANIHDDYDIIFLCEHLSNETINRMFSEYLYVTDQN